MFIPALAVATATTPLLSVTQVSKIYGDGDHRFVAVQGVNLSLQEDEFVCLLGPSGCGKSTLLRIITGLNTATSGTVHYRGQVVPGVNPHATIVFQTFALYPWLTVLQNVEIALKARGVALPERRQRAGQLLETVGLAGFEAAYPRELSGGMRQKVGFARAMAVEPELLCLDEPFSALDVLSAEALRGELLELWLHKTIPTRAILMVTHNIEEAVLLADRIVIMGKDPGHIVSELTVTLHHPRRRKDTAVQALVDQVFAIVTGHIAPPVDAPGQPRHRLPHARLNALAGLVEKLANEGGSANLYRISGELMLHLDELLPLVEAGERVEFLTVQAGDVRLTPLGQTYADASILARKELLAARILRLPAPRWIYEILQQDDNQRVDRHYFLDKLSADFGDQTEEQLEIIINWGRYAELFAYDSGSNELYLES